MDAITNLEWRGLIQDCSDWEGMRRLPAGEKFYVGIDPTAPSLQIGNLIPLMTAIHLGRHGFLPIILFGGATGAIGDPSGKSAERPLLPRETIERNIAGQKAQARTIFERCDLHVEFVDNYEWTAQLKLIDFLRDIGKHFTVNYMLSKEVIKTRLNGDGISFAEFSYMLLQSHDFLHLYQTRGCRIQMGGSDQWGNVTAGLELIRKKIQGEAYAFSWPLLLNSRGVKFGKSESGTLWLSADLTSPFKFHQFFLNSSDQDVIKLLKIFTFLDQTEIANLEESLRTCPEKREAQKTLADAICALVHGEQALEDAKRGAQVLFGGSLKGVPISWLEEIFSEVPSASLPLEHLKEMSVVDLLAAAQAVASKAEAKRLAQSGGIYINNERITDGMARLSELGVLDQKLFVVRTGKKSYHLIRVE
ncbi:MAG: tyrosine--tRNA ligase [Deltaproteobacteria bacterium]|nr:tyrosine--tRNA ligase [Deltaproteobacteria bacterium]